MVMGECRGGGDGLIKLFGKTIPVPEPAKDLDRSASSNSNSNSNSNSSGNSSGSAGPDSPGAGTPQDASPQPEVVDPAVEQPAGDDAAGQRERLRRPDKVLPCPRCTSTDTKFCYFNNYNVNQPRHFCKNCQRYWTAGGAMRNVPVGAGRRKNKNAAAAAASHHFLHRVRAGAALPADALNATNGTVLSFAHAHAEPHLKDKLLLAPPRSAGGGPPVVGPCASEGSTNRQDDRSHGDGVREASSTDKPASGAAAWPYGCAAAPSSPAYFSSGIAIPIYPAAPAYWGCMVPGAWSLPWPAPPPSHGLSSPTSTAPSVSSGPDSLALGKHPREQGDEGRSGGGHGKVWAPKTIRIDDADEVARSSIWSLIGIKGDRQQDAGGGRRKLGGTVFEPRGEAKAAKQAMITSSPLLDANPVALTRSVTFQEGS